ncbi:MAG TPA: tRNA lysidine(34) synthetase TilS [Solirubrobacteraceae bacterium]|nr:tRNA lysidine(34) synthetase TilS [Solirubrobacteraceae bacterium]
MNGDSPASPAGESQTSDPDAVAAQIASEELLRPGQPVLVLLSGGRDSVALLDIAVRIAGPENVAALHVNYGLRGLDTDADQAHCEAICASLNVPLHVHRVERRGAGNLQAWAREARYAAAEATAPAGADIATGHTATDQVETILLRLASSPSRRALLGMAPRRERLVRPLLFLTRDQTAAYCTARGLAWREDATNDTPAYARGRARANLVPALRELHPAAEQNVLALAETLRAEAAVLDELVEAALNGQPTISLDAARALPPALAALVLQRLADTAAGRPAPGTAARAHEILALGPHAELHLPHGIRVQSRRGTLQFLNSPR